MSKPSPSLGPYLDQLYRSYDQRFLDSDPLCLVRPYEDPIDREISGLFASMLAYGQVPTILASTRKVLAAFGEKPRDVLAKGALTRVSRRLRGFRHRWTGRDEILAVTRALRWAMQAHGSLGGLYRRSRDEAEGQSREAMAHFCARLLEATGQEPNRGLKFCLPSPGNGSACKRMNLYFRWMIRRDDGLDLGVWTDLDPADLIMPLDTHVARIAQNLGLARPRTPGWPMAEEITDGLRRLDPEDPIKYDFAMSRLGILSHCPRKRREDRCGECLIQSVCRL